MVWMVRAKGVPLKMRDMSTGVMRTVGRDWISFGAIPPGIDPVLDRDMEFLHEADAAAVAEIATVIEKRGRGRPRKVS